MQLPKHAEIWLPGYVSSRARVHARRAPAGPIHVLFCIADHFEPGNGNVDQATQLARVDRWARALPSPVGGFRDADGRPPRHTFFFPIEAYSEAVVSPLADLCAAGVGEVEIHLHHDHDTSSNLRQTLNDAVDRLTTRHGLL